MYCHRYYCITLPFLKSVVYVHIQQNIKHQIQKMKKKKILKYTRYVTDYYFHFFDCYIPNVYVLYERYHLEVERDNTLHTTAIHFYFLYVLRARVLLYIFVYYPYTT
jgi:hypothetical protein